MVSIYRKSAPELATWLEQNVPESFTVFALPKEHRRRSLARVLYDRVQSVLETTLYPSGWLSEDAYHFWQDRGCFFLQWYQQVDDFKGMWLSPKALLTLRDLAAAQMMDWSEDAKAS